MGKFFIFRKRFMFCLLVCMMVFFCLEGCGKATGGSGGSDEKASQESMADAPVYTGEEDGIRVTLSIDKGSYEKGEEVNTVLTVYNDKEQYTVSMVNINKGSSDEFVETKVPSFTGTIKTGEFQSSEGTMVAYSEKEVQEATYNNMAIQGDVKTVAIRPYIKVNYGGEELTVRYVVNVVMFQNKVAIDTKDKKNVKTVSVHDPSIVIGTDKTGKKCYYIFGSHLAFAKSYDLENWEPFTNNINTDFRTIFEEPANWSAHGSSNYNVQGFMWAPDVLYNKQMGKWCMYMSIDGDKWYSSIVLLTADTLEGDWKYEGIVVYSGFNKDNFMETDVKTVLGEDTLHERYSKKWGDYYPNNIDPCVFYDENDILWMSYGSWSGGIFMLKLDEATGLRDYSVTYEDSIHSDPYFGTKIAGGAYVSGEASYIQHIGDYYYLFISYGNLEAKGGYNVRIFRSKKPDGDYVDALGNTPYFDEYVFNYNLPVGVRLFGGYKWRTMGVGQVAQGHNSAFVDDDGKAYIVFHTRTTNGSEGHYVKVHQLFLNKNDWLVAAPYQTAAKGETLDASLNTVENISGEYDLIVHKLDIDFKNLETVTPENVELCADGTIKGAYTGTWEVTEGTSFISLNMDGVNYDGVTLSMEIENTTLETVVFTALGDTNQITIWGSKIVE